MLQHGVQLCVFFSVLGALSYLSSLPDKTLGGLAPLPPPPPPPPPSLPPSQPDLQSYLPPPPMRIPLLPSQYLNSYPPPSKSLLPPVTSPETVIHPTSSPTSSPVPSVVLSPNTSKMLQSAIESDEHHLMPLSPGTEHLPHQQHPGTEHLPPPQPITTIIVSHSDCMYANSMPRASFSHMSYEPNYLPKSVIRFHQGEQNDQSNKVTDNLDEQLDREVTGLTEMIIEPGKEGEQTDDVPPKISHMEKTVFRKPKDTPIRKSSNVPGKDVDPSPFLDPSSVEIEVGKEGEVTDEEEKETEDRNEDELSEKDNEASSENSKTDEDEEDTESPDGKSSRRDTPAGYESDSSLYSLIGKHKLQGSSVRHPILEPLYQREKNKIHKHRYISHYHGNARSGAYGKVYEYDDDESYTEDDDYYDDEEEEEEEDSEMDQFNYEEDEIDQDHFGEEESPTSAGENEMVVQDTTHIPKETEAVGFDSTENQEYDVNFSVPDNQEHDFACEETMTAPMSSHAEIQAKEPEPHISAVTSESCIVSSPGIVPQEDCSVDSTALNTTVETSDESVRQAFIPDPGTPCVSPTCIC